MWKQNRGRPRTGNLAAFSEVPQKIPPHTRPQKSQPAYGAWIFQRIHNAHHNNKLLIPFLF